jgi:hypothetical protein
MFLRLTARSGADRMHDGKEGIGSIFHHSSRRKFPE